MITQARSLLGSSKLSKEGFKSDRSGDTGSAKPIYPPPPATMHLVAIGPAIGFIGRFINKICEIKGTAKQDVQDEPVSRDLSGSKFS